MYCIPNSGSRSVGFFFFPHTVTTSGYRHSISLICFSIIQAKSANSLFFVFCFLFFFYSSTSLLLPTRDPPPSCTHAQSCNPMDCSQPGSSVHGLFQARILEWVAISFSPTHCFLQFALLGKNASFLQRSPEFPSHFRASSPSSLHWASVATSLTLSKC